MTFLQSTTGTVLVIGLSSEHHSLMDVRTNADWTLKPRLLAVPGVASVTVFGGEVRELQVQFLPAGTPKFRAEHALTGLRSDCRLLVRQGDLNHFGESLPV
jgi:Cu/Ag efflux pump CusA